MANVILDKFSSSATLTITLASLSTSLTRASAVVDNSTNRFRDLLIFGKFKLGTSPTGNKGFRLYLLRDDAAGTPHRTDGWNGTDSVITPLNAPQIATATTGTSPATGTEIYVEALIQRPGPKWGIAVFHDTGVNLDATASNHWVRWIGLNPEVQ